MDSLFIRNIAKSIFMELVNFYFMVSIGTFIPISPSN